MNTMINWDYPQPRAGLAGALDRFFGPGTTRAEAWLQGIFFGCSRCGTAGLCLSAGL